MTSLLTILLYLWLAITGVMIVLWFLRRRRDRKKAEASAKQAVPHPALVAINAGDASKPTTAAAAGLTTGESVTGATVAGSTATITATTATDQAGGSSVEQTAPHPGDATGSAETVEGSDSDDGDGDNEDDEAKIVILGNEGGGDLFDDDAITDDATTDNPIMGDPTTDDPTTDDLSTDRTATDDHDTAGDHDMMSLSEPTTDPGPPATSEPRTLSDMLDGVELPYDLTPVTTAVEDPDRHLIFLTTHSNAEEVGTKFADELTRLGFEFEPVGLDQAVATRDADVVSMVIVPKAVEVDGGNGPRYGAAGVGDVALELWVGRSSAPPVVA